MKKNHETTVPTNIRELVKACGGNGAEAARRMGVAGSLVSKALLDDSTRMVNDLAAKAVLADMPSGKDSSSDVRKSMRQIALYMSRTPALSMPADIFNMLDKTVKELAQEYLN